MRARIRPDFLVNNTNVQNMTEAKDLILAQALLEGVASRLHIPIGLVVGERRLYNSLPAEMQALFFSLCPMMRLEWMEGTI